MIYTLEYRCRACSEFQINILVYEMAWKVLGQLFFFRKSLRPRNIFMHDVVGCFSEAMKSLQDMQHWYFSFQIKIGLDWSNWFSIKTDGTQKYEKYNYLTSTFSKLDVVWAFHFSLNYFHAIVQYDSWLITGQWNELSK